MNFGGRTVAFKSLVGSHNYNLNTEESDRDYKVFLLPTFDDLYFNNSFSKSYIGETEDYDVHDIRKCSSLWHKANVNFLEVLFSEDFSINSNLDIKSERLISELYQMRNDIAKMNLKYLYDACIGMYYNKMKYIEKGTEGTQHLVDKFGYDTKQALHAWRILDFIRRFEETGFDNFKKAIWYTEDDNKRQFLLNVKNGKFSLDEYKELVAIAFKNIEEEFKDKYRRHTLDEDTNNRLLEIIKELVKINIV